MTDEKKVLVLVLVLSILFLLYCVFMLIWNIQTANTPWAWFWGIVALSPVASGFETLRRWNRG